MGPSSGPFAGVGREVRKGATLAAEEINRRGGLDGRKVRLAFRDDAEYAKIVTLLRDLVRRERPVAVIGPENVAAVRTKSNPLAREGVAALTVGGSAGSIAQNPLLFRLSPSNQGMAEVLVDWLVEVRSIRKVAVASVADDWGRDGAAALRRELERRGVTPVATEELVHGTIDVSPLAQSLRASGAEAVAVWARPDDAARLAAAVRQIGWGAQISGPDVLFEAQFRSLAGAASENAVLAFPLIREEQWFGARLRDWFLAYHRRFTLLPIAGQRTLVADLPMHAIGAYDAVGLILDAVRRSSSTEPGEVARALARTRSYEGVVTTYTFSPGRREAFTPSGLRPARFYNLALLYDVTPGADLERQIAFYKVQVSAYYVPDTYRETEEGRKLAERVLEDVLTNPESVEFFKAYEPPRPPPGPL